MTEARRLRLADLIPLLLVLAVAAGARVGYLITYAGDAGNPGPMIVQDAPPELALPLGGRLNEVEALAQNIKEYRWFGTLAPFAPREEQTAHVAPGYPWLLGELERILPSELGPFDRFLRWAQCVLGVLTAGLYYLIAREAFPGRLVAFLTGLLCALHPFWVVSTAAVNDGVLATFMLGAALWLGVRAQRFDGALTALLFGLTLAGLTLVRAALLPFAVIAVLGLLHRSRRLASGWQYGLLTVLGFVLGLAPWFVRNAQVFGDIYPIVDSTYLHLWAGNNPRATGGPLSEQALFDALPEETRNHMRAPTLSQAGRYRLL
ncbi:MAG: glycosyltransferase family 39 protein, partial [Planctomycetia bacterium]|nr:glycosyltransferase family 39 protein [Planctomycetia bacterium]